MVFSGVAAGGKKANRRCLKKKADPFERIDLAMS
jgi:hypothetical protein